MREFSWYTENKPHISTYINGEPKKRYLVVDGIAVIGRCVMKFKPNRKGGHHHRRNYCICNMCGHWFRRNKGIHDEDKYGPIHICCGVCYELAIQSANLEADVGGGFQANYWDQEEIEEWEKKNSSLTE